jgi:hypothetical protein
MKYTDGYTDGWKLFRRCFLCKGRKNLLRVAHPAYDTTFSYYHEDCLVKVMASPEESPHAIDSAIQIMDQLHSNELKQQEARRRLQVQVQRLKRVVSGEKEDTIRVPPPAIKSRYLILKKAHE